jgi:hypothetical protein
MMVMNRLKAGGNPSARTKVRLVAAAVGADVNLAPPDEQKDRERIDQQRKDDSFRRFLHEYHALVGGMVQATLRPIEAAGGGVSVATSHEHGLASERQRTIVVTGLLHTIDPVTRLVYIVSLPSNAAHDAVGTPAAPAAPATIVTSSAAAAGCDDADAVDDVDVRVHAFAFQSVAVLSPRRDLPLFEIALGSRGGTAGKRWGRRRQQSSSLSPSAAPVPAAPAASSPHQTATAGAHGDTNGAGFVPRGSGDSEVEDEGGDEDGDGEAQLLQVQSRKQRVVQQLRRFRVPFTEEREEDGGTLHVLQGALRIHPPYGLADCVSANEMVLQRVAQILEF